MPKAALPSGPAVAPFLPLYNDSPPVPFRKGRFLPIHEVSDFPRHFQGLCEDLGDWTAAIASERLDSPIARQDGIFRLDCLVGAFSSGKGS